MDVIKMRLPDNKFVDLSFSDKETIEVDSGEKFKFRLPDLEDSNAKTKYIFSIEKLIRKSFEYSNYIRFLKEKMDLTKCKFLKNIDIKEIKVSLEMHHYPFSLYDLTEIILDRRIKLDLPINDYLIAEDVMRLHYENKVGLVPLTVTVHELVHDGQLFIPTNFVYGNYNKFVEEYNDYISDLHKNYLNSIRLNTTKIMEGTQKFNTDVLRKKTIEVNDKSCENKKVYLEREKDKKEII